MNTSDVSIIIPACNEAEGLALVLPELTRIYPDAEILVINDGSTDQTAQVCETYHVRCINRPYRMGNGAAVKAGAREASRNVLYLWMPMASMPRRTSPHYCH